VFLSLLCLGALATVLHGRPTLRLLQRSQLLRVRLLQTVVINGGLAIVGAAALPGLHAIAAAFTVACVGPAAAATLLLSPAAAAVRWSHMMAQPVTL